MSGAHVRRRRGPWVRRLVLALACLVLLGAAWTGARAAGARGDLAQASRLVAQLEREARGGDIAAARRTLTALRAETRAARIRTTGPDWWLARRAPVAGPSATAAQTLVQALDDVARHGLPALLDAAGGIDLSTVVPRGGRMDLTAVAAAAPALAGADAQLRAVLGRVAAIEVDGLVPQVRAAVTAFREGLDRLVSLTGAAVRAATLLPSLLGADRPRTYLMLVQNLAELRATGGMAGAFAVLRADRGQLRIVRQGAAATDLKAFTEPVLPLAPAMRLLYTDRLGTYPANVNLTPHFPTAAALAREMYRRRYGQTVDGVLAVDPVALSYLLRATGPVRVPGGRSLTADGAVATLLSDVYLRAQDAGAEDRYFANAARAVFDALGGAAVHPRTALDMFARAARERRILLWTADPRERAAIAGTVLEGALPERDGERPTVGVFLNDGSGAKLGYYLRPAADLRVTGCRPDGRLELAVRVTLSSTAPRSGLPRSVLGLGLAGDPYTVRTNVMVFSPAQGAIVTARMDGAAAALGTGAERARAVGVITVDVPPGASRTVEMTLLTAPMPRGSRVAPRPDLWLTPTATAWRTSVGPDHVCGRPR
ncbi:DUF4012 domain-containing protein [Phytohabitans sp. ZYX-F-186]|uniref:DUF4012 domain-containing protein n=1 Tax=Phytohabitans maris TaxID=3071409 RepID=A0ABU0ZMF3_9ACTN|nr:DUF4012 domain-containing protein [Phytohabitans sp. ZYX-F-186]MDQ7908221.1 DUF4012 domain-containing protein [Phytohabitans sp. ZYX-F-186]